MEKKKQNETEASARVAEVVNFVRTILSSVYIQIGHSYSHCNFY